VQILLLVIRLLLALCPWMVHVLTPARAVSRRDGQYEKSSRRTLAIYVPIAGWLEIDADLLFRPARSNNLGGCAERAGPPPFRSNTERIR